MTCALTQAAELSVKTNAGIAVSGFSVLDGVEAPEIHPFASNPDERNPLPTGTIKTHTLSPAGVSLLGVAVPSVLHLARDAKICAPIIQAVSVNMVYDTTIWWASQRAVHIDGLSAFRSDCVGNAVPIERAPVPPRQGGNIGDINGRNMPFCEGDVGDIAINTSGSLEVGQNAKLHRVAINFTMGNGAMQDNKDAA